LQDVQFTDRAASLFNKPWINAKFVKQVSVHKVTLAVYTTITLFGHSLLSK